MAKSKKAGVKTPKKHSTKYSKLAAVCSKELSAKKAALVRAEKALAKAQSTHAELLSEVARLDMLDRSLKALINGTEPPQNVRYVYTYPQWVWYPYNGWWWNGNAYTLTLGAQGGQNYSNFQGGQFYNANTVTNTVTTPSISTGTFTTGALSLSNADSGSITCSASGGLDGTSNFSFSSNSSPAWQMTTTSDPSGTTYSVAPPASQAAEFTVDLSTGAQDESKAAEAALEEVAAAIEEEGE